MEERLGRDEAALCLKINKLGLKVKTENVSDHRQTCKTRCFSMWLSKIIDLGKTYADIFIIGLRYRHTFIMPHGSPEKTLHLTQYILGNETFDYMSSSNCEAQIFR